MGQTYSQEAKRAALKLYAEVGPAEAERLCGIPSATIRQWAHRERERARRAARNGDEVSDPHGVTRRPEKARAAVDAARLSWEQRRTRVGRLAGAIAEDCIERAFDARPRDRADLMRAAAMAIDKAQLLVGGPTSRTELSANPEEAREQLRQLRDELAERREAKAA